jgi:hypothetical protein
MVWRRMGLLDDAIREHLELKRRRGADPGDVAREQREALDAVPRDGAAGTGQLDQDASLADNHTPGIAPVAAPGVVPVAAPPVEDDGAPAPQSDEPAHANVDETAELDMRSVLGEDEQDDEGAVEDGPRDDSAAEDPARRPADAAPPEEDSLEWEVPGEVAEEPSDTEEPEEDVLEETPEFLRDTPEQERLWFEQRPPRDFDFDK